MYISQIVLSNDDSKTERGLSPVILRHTAWGYEISTFTKPDNKKVYLRSVYKGKAKYYLDYTHAGHFSYKTAMKHAENILKDKYSR